MPKNAAAKDASRRLFVYNGGFLTQKRVRRILSLAGYDIRLGKPGPDDAIGVWGQSPTAPRGEKVADHTEAPIIRVEDAFLRSVLTGRDGAVGLGLLIDKNGVHFDPTNRSDLETLLSEHPLDNTHLLARAKNAIADFQRLHLSKYNAHDLTLVPPAPGYVLVIDQTRGDASVKASSCDLNTFREMLYYAQEEHPTAQILIKTHPETAAGHRRGYFSETDCTARVSLVDAPYSPYVLFEGAIAVYTVSSQMGFEAILTGHRPVVFGQPFYMGWGLTDDRKPLDRRQRKLTRAQLFAAAMILYPHWYDRHRDQICELEDVIASLSADTREWRDDHEGWTAHGMKLWKRQHLQKMFGRYKRVRFTNETETASGRHMVWASKTTTDTIGLTRVEDGFLRSKGLGAELVPPLSLVLDDIGIYYDPQRESRLERMIAASVDLPDGARLRAENLIERLRNAQLSKYNTGNTGLTEIPAGRRILVPGQVEDDASIRYGTDDISTNIGLLAEVRRINPAAVIIYKPHPDIEAGLRQGAVPDAAQYADVILDDADPISALAQVDEVWTLTSFIGFEAMLRGIPVTCLGKPAYSGWGLTTDRWKPITRRAASPDLVALTHAILIDYPRYFDPITNSACPVEVIVDRLEHNEVPRPRLFNRSLSKLQGLFASFAYLWR